MISKLIVHGKDRQEALALLQRALGQYQVVGPSTNIEFLKRVAAHEGFKEGGVETNFIPVGSFSVLGRMASRTCWGGKSCNL